jgi:hypothetical protein
VQSIEMPGIAFDGHMSPSRLNTDTSGVKIEGPEHFNTIFRLLCTCGCDSHLILGHYWRNPDFQNVLVFVSPIALCCSVCGKVTELFDTAIHGYDAEVVGIPSSYRGEGKRTEFVCDKCGPRQVQVFARFEYPNDMVGSEFDEYRGREQDLFSWISLIGKCADCGRMIEVAEFECA